MQTQRTYGWSWPKKQPTTFKVFPQRLISLPSKVDLRPRDSPVYDQLTLGSCTANALAGAMEFNQRKQGLPTWVPSRLFIYYQERFLEGTVSQDSGAEISDGVNVVNCNGVCREITWPYDVNRFASAPPEAAIAEAFNCQSVEAEALNNANIDDLKACLAGGEPFVFGFTVYESFESDAMAATGQMAMPFPAEKELGGHAVMAAGYDDSMHAFIIRNSWSPDWGLGGYFYMPYAFISDTSQCSDFWTIKLIKETSPVAAKPAPSLWQRVWAMILGL